MIKSSKFLSSQPKLFGFTPVELTLIMVSISLLSTSFPNQPLLVGGLVLGIAAILLAVKTFFGPSQIFRFFRALFDKRKIVSDFDLVSFEILDPAFSQHLYDTEDGALDSARDVLKNLPQNFKVSFQFLRRKVEVEKNALNDEPDAVSILRAERRAAFLAEAPFFENRVYVFCDKKQEGILRNLLTELRLDYRETRLPEFKVEGLASSQGIHGKEHHFSFELNSLPLEYSLRDVSQFLRHNCEVTYTVSFFKKSSARAIQMFSMKSNAMKNFKSSRAGEIEAGLVREESERVISSLIRGEEALFATQAITTFHSDKYFELPQMAFRDSITPIGHIGPAELRALHMGKMERVMEKTQRGVEVMSISGLHFLHHSPKIFPNFYTPEKELVAITSFQEGKLPNGNAMLFGPSGKGKSMMLSNLFAYLLEETDSKVIILDTGRGFENLIRAYGGKTFEMTTDTEPAGMNVMQILKKFDQNFAAENLINFTRFLCSSEGHIDQASLSKLRKLSSKVHELNSLGDWIEVLSKNCPDLAESLVPFCRGEIYGEHFDSANAFELNDKLLYFTGPIVNPGQSNPLLIPYFFIVNLLVASRAKIIGASAPTLICWDEVAFLMAHAPEVVSSMWNCMRKTGNSVLASAQHPDQIMKFSCGEDILQNSPTRWILGLAEGPSILDKIMKISAEKQFLVNRLPGDFFLVGREKEKLFLNFSQSALHYALFTTSKKERTEIEAQIADPNSALSVINGAAAWARVKFGAAALALCLALAPYPAKASLFGEENVPLYAILAQVIQEVLVVTEQLNEAKRHYEEFQGIYAGYKDTLEDLKTTVKVITSNARTFHDVTDKAEAVDKLLRNIKDLKDQVPSIKREADVVAESIIYQGKAFAKAEQMHTIGAGLAEKARTASPGLSQKITAQGTGLMVQALGDLNRTEAERLRLETLNTAARLREETERELITRSLKLARSGEDIDYKRRPY